MFYVLQGAVTSRYENLWRKNGSKNDFTKLGPSGLHISRVIWSDSGPYCVLQSILLVFFLLFILLWIITTFGCWFFGNALLSSSLLSAFERPLKASFYLRFWIKSFHFHHVGRLFFFFSPFPSVMSSLFVSVAWWSVSVQLRNTEAATYTTVMSSCCLAYLCPCGGLHFPLSFLRVAMCLQVCPSSCVSPVLTLLPVYLSSFLTQGVLLLLLFYDYDDLYCCYCVGPLQSFRGGQTYYFGISISLYNFGYPCCCLL